MKHSNPIHTKQAHKIADMVQRLKAGDILRGALPPTLTLKNKACAA